MTANINGKEIPKRDWLEMYPWELDEDQESERLDYCLDTLSDFVTRFSDPKDITRFCFKVLIDKVRE